jgi:glc operon protein GlcG
MPESYPVRLIAEVIRLYPEYLRDPLDADRNAGNSAVFALGPDGVVHGHVFGTDQALGQKVFQIGSRKLLQVWRTGYPTGRFEELVYAGKLDESTFGILRPDFIGWHGGVPLLAPDGGLIAAAFSGFRGATDVAILERAAAAVGLTVKRV